MKRCPHCGVEKPPGEFYVRCRDGKPSAWCKPCTRGLAASRRADHYDDALAYQRRYLADRRSEALDALGGACLVCGEDDDVVLQIDHVNGDGGQERRRRSSYSILRAVINGEPGYQLLCANCHVRKTRAAGEHRARA